MSTEFLLPDLGEGLPDAELIQWHVQVGDTVSVNQPLAEVETAKAVMDLPSPYAGVVSGLHAEAGSTVLVGSVLISFDDDAPAPDADAGTESAEDVVPPNLVGYGAAPTSTTRPARRARVIAEPDTPTHPAPGVAATPASPPALPAERPRSTPPVRRLARDLGVDLDALTGTGPDGLIVRADVEAAAVSNAPVAPEPPAPTSMTRPAPRAEKRTPIRGVRKVTADAMVRSAFTAPHVTCFHSVDVTETMAFIQRLRDDAEFASERIGVLAVVATAVCAALRRNGALNSRWDEAAGEIVEPAGVRLGFAAATPRGLLVPNVADADLLSLVGMSRAIQALTASARAGTITPADMQGGTFSITNIGTFGIEAGTPILNPGEAGILAVGAVQRRPWEHQGEIALRQIMTLSLSFDHRLVDGEQGARFLVDVARLLEDPARAML